MEKSLLNKLYWDDKMSLREIAKDYSFTDKTVVSRLMKKYNIPVRQATRRRISVPSKSLLYKLYIRGRNSTHQIAEDLGCSQSYIMFCLKQEDIPLRDKEKAKIETLGKEESKQKIAAKSKEMWQDKQFQKKMSLLRGGTGVPYENSKYPKEFNKELKTKILQRDNYTCRLCGRPNWLSLQEDKCSLAVHHIDYEKTNCKEENLMASCIYCNALFNSNRGDWKSYWQKQVKGD